MKKIAIDCRFWGIEHTGLGRYTENLVKSLLKLDGKNQYFLLFREMAKSQIEKSLAGFKNKTLVKADIDHYSLKEQFLIPKILNAIKPDLAHFLHFNVPIFYQGKFIVTIHDLTKHYSKGAKTTTRMPFIYWFKYLNYHLIFSKAVKKAVHILVPSEFVKLQLIKVYALSKDKISITKEGVDNLFFQKSNQEKTQERIKRFRLRLPYLVYVGNLYPHKNILSLVKAIKLVNKKQQNGQLVRLVIVCSRDVFLKRFKKELKTLKANHWVQFVQQPTDRELQGLYQKAIAFITPSLIEGFGLPGIEAMATGCLVLAANSSCLPEIYGRHALYFDPHDFKDIAIKIKQLLNYSAEVKPRLSFQAIEWVKQYSWKKTASKTLKIYQLVL